MRVLSLYISTLDDAPRINCTSDDKPGCIVAAYGATKLDAVRSKAMRVQEVYEWHSQNGCYVTWQRERSDG